MPQDLAPIKIRTEVEKPCVLITYKLHEEDGTINITWDRSVFRRRWEHDLSATVDLWDRDLNKESKKKEARQ